MGVEKQAKETKETACKRLYGVKPETFEKMASILRREWSKLHDPGGRPSKLTVREKLAVTLKRIGECRTMESISADCGVGKSTACETIKWVEGTLKKDNALQPPGKKALRQDDSPVRYVAVDVSESPIQRQKNPKRMAFREKEAPYGKGPGDCRTEE
jgi:hypothetical protein